MKNGLLLSILPFFCLVTFFVFFNNSKESKAGEQYVYTWQSTTVGYNDMQHLYQADTNTFVSFFKGKSLQSLRVSINCRIVKTVIRRDVKGELVCFQIKDPTIEVEQAGQAVNCALLKEELTHPVFIEINRQGLMKIVRVDTAILNFSATLVQGFLSRLQFVKPAEKINEWQIAEENTCGVYLAKYRQVQSYNSGLEFEKTNGGYIQLKFPGQNQRIKDDGKTNITTDTAGVVVGISGEERQVVRFNADTVALSSSIISVTLQKTTMATYNELESLKKLIRSPNYNYQATLGEALSEDRINRMVYTKTLGNDNLASLMEALSLQEEKEEENLILKFRALAYLFPNHCNDLGRILKKVPLESYSFRVLSSALANAETESALNALVSVINARRAEEETVIALLPLLATSKTPTEQSVSIAKHLAFSSASTPDIASTAQLALGGQAYNFKKTNKKRLEQITAFLLDKMKLEKDTLQKIMVLANTGSAMILPVLKSYIVDPGISNEIRMAAISGLRLMDDSSSANYLNKMTSHRDTSIVKKVKEVIAFKEQYKAGN